jgi:hypothetical protein
MNELQDVRGQHGEYEAFFQLFICVGYLSFGRQGTAQEHPATRYKMARALGREVDVIETFKNL